LGLSSWFASIEERNMNLIIRQARPDDLFEYTDLLQKTYQDAYVNDEIGLTIDCFSPEVFNTPDTQDYLRSNLIVNDKQKCWLAFVESKMVGAVTIVERDSDYELRGFYVATEFQGKGIGRKLWEKVLEGIKNKDIVLDIYTHNTRSIKIYNKWGFEIDMKKGQFYRHWNEWPEGVRANCMYMRLRAELVQAT